jgi:hypothetical protein
LKIFNFSTTNGRLGARARRQRPQWPAAVRDPMKFQPKVIDISPIPGLHLDPTFTREEATILRSLVAGKYDKHDLRMPPDSFVRVIRDTSEKTGRTSNLVVMGPAADAKL